MMANTKLVPTDSSSPLEKLEYEHAILYAAYQERVSEIKGLQELIGKYMDVFGAIEVAMKGVLK